MLLLLIGFAVFYIRSAVARLAVERLGDDARAAAAANAVARDEAVEASNAKSMFIATVSHELRTPLTGVIGMSELLLDSKLDPQQREYAHLSRSAAESLLLVINDILDYSKIEAGRIELYPTNFSLRETIGEACAMLLVSAKGKGIELVVDMDSELPAWLHGDAARLRQIVLNLVSNAVKFTAKGTVTVTVTAKPLAAATHVRIDVTDTGIGIDPIALPRLFQPFTQADNSTARKYGGTGLGLTISARLIEAMDGTIGVFSTPGEGSTFWVELRLLAASMDESHGPAVRDRGIEIERASRGSMPLVLVAEDNPVNQIIAARALERVGCEVELVSDGREALAAISGTTYAAVLMDCQMPVMDGYEATREVRRRERGSDRHLTIIAMTAHTMAGDREKCLSTPSQTELLREALASNSAHPLHKPLLQ
jgi:signal transduction histidine kinase/CheY-like chemotaxis protein